MMAEPQERKAQEMSEMDGGDENSEDTDEVYEVEKIVGMCHTKDGPLYKVRWLGYGPNWDTWEPPDNLSTCTDLIEDFVKKQKQQKDKKKAVTKTPGKERVQTQFDSNIFSAESTTQSEAEDKSPDKPPKKQHSDEKAKQKLVEKSNKDDADKPKKKEKTWYYVSSSDEEADTLKDKFWRELEQGKIDVFSNDLYSKVKATGRSSRPQSFKECYKNQPLHQEESSKDSDASSVSKTQKRRSSVEEKVKTQKSDLDKQDKKKKSSLKRQDSKESIASKHSDTSNKSSSSKGKRGRIPKGKFKSEAQVKLAKQKKANEPASVEMESPSMPASCKSEDYEPMEGVDCDGSAAVRDETESLMARRSLTPLKDSNASTSHDAKSGKPAKIEPMELSLKSEGKKETQDYVRTDECYSNSGSYNLRNSTHGPSAKKVKLLECRVSLTRLRSGNSAELEDVECQEELVHEHVDDSMDRDSLYQEEPSQSNATGPSTPERQELTDNVKEELCSDIVGENASDVVPIPKDAFTYRTAPPSVESSATTRDIPSSCFSSCSSSSSTQDTSPATFALDAPSPLTNISPSPSSIVSATAATQSSSPTHSQCISQDSSVTDTDSSKPSLLSNASSVAEPDVDTKKRKLNISATSVDIDPKKTRLDLSACSIGSIAENAAPAGTQVYTGSSSSQAGASQTVSAPGDPALQESVFQSEQSTPWGRNPRMVQRGASSGLGSSVNSGAAVNGAVQNRRGSMGYNGVNNNNQGEENMFDLAEAQSPASIDKVQVRHSVKNTDMVIDLTPGELRQCVKLNEYNKINQAVKRKLYDLEQPDRNGQTLLMIAAHSGFDDMVELLLISGARINAESKNNTTALMMAADMGLRCTVELLIVYGANINMCNFQGETALIKAVKHGHRHVVQILLENGANFALPHNSDNTAMRFAKNLNHRDILDLLSSHIKRVTVEFEKQVMVTLNNTAEIMCALFPMQVYNLRETTTFRLNFRHELLPTRQGVGMLLFIAHARITSTEVRCRLYGPCAVQSVLLNNTKLTPLTEEGNFVLSFCPLLNGNNNLEINTVKAPTSKARLVLCAYKARLIQ